MKNGLFKGVLALGAFGSVLAGCNGNDDGGPIVSPTATATASATASGTPASGAGPNLTAIALSNIGTATSNLGQTLYVFNAQRPGTASRNIRVTGLPSGVRLLGIDYRPANRALYGLGSNANLYILDASSGVARAVGTGFGNQVAIDTSDEYGFDFNPVPDRIRVVSDAGQNYRLNPNTGAAVDSDTSATGFQRDGDLQFDSSDTNSGDGPNVVAAAYTNSVAGATTTTNYAIEAGNDVLVTQGTRAGVTPSVSPNTGRLYTVGSLGVTDITSFDIGRNNVALAASNTTLYQINLATGAATRIGGFTVAGTPGAAIVGLALVP
jgi:hypothetical protein